MSADIDIYQDIKQITIFVNNSIQFWILTSMNL